MHMDKRTGSAPRERATCPDGCSPGALRVYANAPVPLRLQGCSVMARVHGWNPASSPTTPRRNASWRGGAKPGPADGRVDSGHLGARLTHQASPHPSKAGGESLECIRSWHVWLKACPAESVGPAACHWPASHGTAMQHSSAFPRRFGCSACLLLFHHRHRHRHPCLRETACHCRACFLQACYSWPLLPAWTNLPHIHSLTCMYLHTCTSLLSGQLRTWREVPPPCLAAAASVLGCREGESMSAVFRCPAQAALGANTGAARWARVPALQDTGGPRCQSSCHNSYSVELRPIGQPIRTPNVPRKQGVHTASPALFGLAFLAASLSRSLSLSRSSLPRLSLSSLA